MGGAEGTEAVGLGGRERLNQWLRSADIAIDGPISSDSHAFTDLVLDRLIADNKGDESWADLVLAAATGAGALEAALDGDTVPRPARERTREKDTPASEPLGAYLRSITVEGFRGIGPAATLQLTPASCWLFA